MSGLLIDDFRHPAHDKNVELRLTFRLVEPREDLAVHRQENIELAICSATNCKCSTMKKPESAYSGVGAMLKLPMAKYA